MDAADGITKTFKIPISYLDYEHIEKCTNVLELEKIYLTLKTGEEGKYPDLEAFCEDRLRKLNPASRVLRKATELINLNQLDSDAKESILNDFQSWISDMKSIDETLKKPRLSDNGDNDRSSDFPIRNKREIAPSDSNKQKSKSSNKSCKPKDYNEWSKIANELEKQMILEEKEETSKPTPVESKPKETSKIIKGLTNQIDTKNMTKLEKEKAALLEKEKGNEAFKSGDLEEAVIYYTRSLSVEPIAAVHNNRGLVYMKQKKWEEAIRDLCIVLKKDPSNIKALQRRATSYSEIHNLQNAITDCQRILKLQPNNKFAENLLLKSSEELDKRAKPKLKDGKRMVITEIGSDEESEDEENEENKNEEKLSLDEEKENDEKTEAETVIVKTDVSNQEDKSEKEFMKIKDYGNQLFKELKYEDALRSYDKLVEGWPSNPIGYRNRAACNLMLDKPHDVIEDCTKAMDLDKSSHLSYYRRGKAFKILKMYEQSCKDLEKALSISPNHVQIKEELDEVKCLLEQEQLSENSAPNATEELNCQSDQENLDHSVPLLLTQMSETSNDETIILSNFDEQESINQDVSNTWEFLGLSDFTDCPVQSNNQESVAIIDRPSKPMTKHEFDKQLSNIKQQTYNWESTIQLLIDVGPTNLSSMIGTKLDGFTLEQLISALLEYSKNKAPAPFIKTVLRELAKVERFCFLKMMISDHAVSELDQLFRFLKADSSDQAEIDCLQHQYL